MSAPRTTTATSGMASQDNDLSTVRPRNRRLISTVDSSFTSSDASHSRNPSPIPSARIGSLTGRNNVDSHVVSARGSPHRNASAPRSQGSGLLDGSWSWASVQDFASSLLGGTDGGYDSPTERSRARNGGGNVRRRHASNSDKPRSTWGPAPPDEQAPQLSDVGTGSLARRDAKFKAMRTASVLESHDGVNGGLDVAGKFKKRNSDEDLRSTFQEQQEEEHLVYIHHVQRQDTYAGIVLRYRCREDAFRKANGLWTRDNIQIRKWLALPVDACEIKGRPCDPSTFESGKIDLLAPTPDATESVKKNGQGDFFSRTVGNDGSEPGPTKEDTERPWTHVRWVMLDSFSTPVEIARVSRKGLGYFPPRRKRSIHTLSTLSTPRASFDVPSITLTSEPVDSPRSVGSRRPSSLNQRPPLSSYSASGAATTRTRGNSTGDELRPAWMRRPGGVGSLGRTVRMPGPEKDSFNTWTNKYLPGFNIDTLPSMSIMGSETAHIGFGQGRGDGPATGIVESHSADGRTADPNAGQGLGLDKAASTIETWLRGAFARRPSTPLLGPRARPTSLDADFIELTDNNSDDGRMAGTTGDGNFAESSATAGGYFGSTVMSYSDGATTRGRTGMGEHAKNNKTD